MTPKKLLTRVSFFFLLLAAFSLSHFSYAQPDTVATDSTATAAEEPASASSSSGVIPTAEANISAGEDLYKGNCASCHRIDQNLVGPALQNVYDRAPSIDWIVSFVQNSQKVISTGDEYAVNIYNEYNKTQMTAFPQFTRDDVLNILAYIKQQDETVAEVPAGQPGDELSTTPQEPAVSTFYLNAIMI